MEMSETMRAVVADHVDTLAGISFKYMLKEYYARLDSCAEIVVSNDPDRFLRVQSMMTRLEYLLVELRIYVNGHCFHEQQRSFRELAIYHAVGIQPECHHCEEEKEKYAFDFHMLKVKLSQEIARARGMSI